MSARAGLVIGLAFAALAISSGAAWGKIRAGVPIEALTPAGTDRTSVRIPAVAGEPVRLGFRESNGKRLVIMDVVVATGAEQARRALAKWTRSLGVEPPSVSGLGDVAYGEGRVYAFARDNVMIAVRVVGDLDARAIAEAALAAVDAAPLGKPASAPITIPFPNDLPSGQSRTLSLPSDIVEAEVTATGAATVRRTASGWLVVRTSDQPATLRVRAVDSLLRVRDTLAP